MRWFTGDPHFHHSNIMRLANRPFESLSEMTEAFIKNWNDRVAHSDTIYCIGDFSLAQGRKAEGPILSTLARLNGCKWLITGNHDKKEVKRCPLWHKVTQYHEIKVDVGEKRRQLICMFHYSQRVWNSMQHGAIQLHGHSHGNLSDIGGKTMDVGVDANNYAPISLDEVLAIMKKRPVVTYDHHKEK